VGAFARGREGGENEREGEEGKTYRVPSAVFLLRADDSAASLGGVERTLAAHDGLTSDSAPAGLASNFRDAVPVIHGVRERRISKRRFVRAARLWSREMGDEANACCGVFCA
jgi:hypothetical protein